MFIKLLTRCHIDYQCWIERSDPRGDPLRASAERVLAAFNLLGLKLEQCARPGGKGGTSTTGKQGCCVFSEEVVETISSLLPDKYKQNVLLLHKQLSAVMWIILSQRKVDVDLFEQLCMDISLNIVDNFPWVRLNHTLHGTIQHSTELIQLNSGYRLGAYSEEGLEANNKDNRNFLLTQSRKISAIEQLFDVMHRLLERSDPLINDRVRNDTNKKLCSVCGSKGHTIRSHGQNTGLPKHEFDTYVECFLD